MSDAVTASIGPDSPASLIRWRFETSLKSPPGASNGRESDVATASEALSITAEHALPAPAIRLLVRQLERISAVGLHSQDRDDLTRDPPARLSPGLGSSRVAIDAQTALFTDLITEMVSGREQRVGRVRRRPLSGLLPVSRGANAPFANRQPLQCSCSYVEASSRSSWQWVRQECRVVLRCWIARRHPVATIAAEARVRAKRRA